MGFIYWMNEGIGVRMSDVYPHLNKHKTFLAVASQLRNEEVEENDFNLDDYMYGEPFQNLAELFSLLDDTSVLTFGDNNEGESYLLYPPSYPWCRRENEPSSIDEVHERIIDVIVRLTDLTREQADELIDNDLYEVGFG